MDSYIFQINANKVFSVYFCVVIPFESLYILWPSLSYVFNI